MKKTILFAIISCVTFMSKAQTIEKTYRFDNYTFEAVGQYEHISFDGSMQSACSGQPDMPWQSIMLALPPHAEADDIDVELGGFTELDGVHSLYPHQPAKAYSDTTRHIFEIDANSYRSSDTYPKTNKGKLTTQYLNGVGIAMSSFCPVEYIPSTGKIRVAKTAKITIRCKQNTRSDVRKVWLTPSNISTLTRLVQNPEMTASYEAEAETLPNYDLLIITTPSYDPDSIGDSDIISFAQYINFYAQRGIRAHCTNTSFIDQNTEGNDLQEKIRNHIKKEYDENGISMVLLGGDSDLVPYRGFYCKVASGGSYVIDTMIPADLYYAGLDGTWNDNGNELWGEEGEDDLFPEIGIGRMCFNDINEFGNITHKTYTYQDFPVLGEFHNVTFAGEHLYDNPLSNGSDYLELLIGEHSDNGYTTIGIPWNYNFTKLYYETGSWNPETLAETINNGTQFVYHQGHANVHYVAGYTNEFITPEHFNTADGTNHNFTFMHTTGCICGDFSRDCILERMTQIPTFAVATLGNSRYGWFNEGQTEGPACHLMRETVDAYFNDRIPQVGMALRESKIQTAPWVTAPGQWEEGALRWNFYCLNLLGDVAVSPWNDEPFSPDISVNEKNLAIGSETLDMMVADKQGHGLYNFTCNIFSNDTLIGRNTTDKNGNTSINLVRPLETETIKLIITGENAWYQTIEYEIKEDGLASDENKLKIYPNPANEVIHIDTDIENCVVTITNSMGQTIFSQKTNGKTNVNTSTFPSGIYYIGVNSSGNANFKKFIKK